MTGFFHDHLFIPAGLEDKVMELLENLAETAGESEETSTEEEDSDEASNKAPGSDEDFIKTVKPGIR